MYAHGFEQYGILPYIFKTQLPQHFVQPHELHVPWTFNPKPSPTTSFWNATAVRSAAVTAASLLASCLRSPSPSLSPSPSPAPPHCWHPVTVQSSSMPLHHLFGVHCEGGVYLRWKWALNHQDSITRISYYDSWIYNTTSSKRQCEAMSWRSVRKIIERRNPALTLSWQEKKQL